MEFITNFLNNEMFKVLIITIVMDLIFGVLRSFKERKVNSCIGINGMIRKTGMLIAVFFLSIIDKITNFNLIGFIPEEVRNFLHIENIGINGVFSILFIVFEFLSIIKNMILCKLPIPKKLQKFLEKIMKEFTSEINENEGEKNEKNN